MNQRNTVSLILDMKNSEPRLIADELHFVACPTLDQIYMEYLLTNRNLLSNSRLIYIIFPQLAREIGLNESIFLQQIHYINFKKQQNILSYHKLQNILPFISERTLKRIVKKLNDVHYISVKHGYKQVNSYTINYQICENFSKSTKFLIPKETFLMFQPDLATELGLYESIILQRIFQMSHSSDSILNNHDEWAKEFCFIQKRTIQRAISKLLKLEYLIKEGVYVNINIVKINGQFGTEQRQNGTTTQDNLARRKSNTASLNGQISTRLDDNLALPLLYKIDSLKRNERYEKTVYDAILNKFRMLCDESAEEYYETYHENLISKHLKNFNDNFVDLLFEHIVKSDYLLNQLEKKKRINIVFLLDKADDIISDKYINKYSPSFYEKAQQCKNENCLSIETKKEREKKCHYCTKLKDIINGNTETELIATISTRSKAIQDTIDNIPIVAKNVYIANKIELIKQATACQQIINHSNTYKCTRDKAYCNVCEKNMEVNHV